MDAMASKSQVIQIPANKSQPSAPPLFSSSISIASGAGGPPSFITTTMSDMSDVPVSSSSTSFMQASAGVMFSTSTMIQTPSATSSNQMGPRPVVRGNASISNLSPEVKKQQEGMTTFSNANKNLLMSEPCNVDGLPSKRLVDQAEGN